MTDLVKYIIDNWQKIAEAIAAIIGAASIIVKITPTLKDDSFLLGIIKFIGKWIALDKYGPAEVKRPT
jgi:flavodoxin